MSTDMRSANAEVFNHDNEAADYDQDVCREVDPIRTGYQDVLRWTIKEAKIDPTSRVLELGSGTGNLSQLIASCDELVCVDVSEKMEALAQPKLRHLTKRRFVRADILEIFAKRLGLFDAVISTYAIHHLTDREKQRLFALVFASLLPGGRAVFGDLMVQNADQKRDKIQHYQSKGDQNTALAITEEYFWLIDLAVSQLQALGFQVKTTGFSDLSYGIVALKPSSS
ncbi:MAG TPA: class I SAM-dependent methyltransferase [Chthoniobacterales bacterium]|nr:class I SAM-dependent methyltransferase [Chthoniobacterales bacterium]